MGSESYGSHGSAWAKVQRHQAIGHAIGCLGCFHCRYFGLLAIDHTAWAQLMHGPLAGPRGRSWPFAGLGLHTGRECLSKCL